MRWLDGTRLNGYECVQTPFDNEGQGRLAYCSLWGCKELDMTERLNRKHTITSQQLVFQFDIQINKCKKYI